MKNTSKQKLQSSKNTSANGAAVGSAGTNPMSQWFALWAEGGRFFADRVQRNLEFQQAAFRCRSPLELMELQSAFLQRAAEQYTVEMGRLTELGSNATLTPPVGTLTPFARRYDDVPV